MIEEIVNKFIESVSQLKVAVVGETIIDQFVKVDYEGQSMKSFCPVFKLDSNQIENQEGGAGAIANHIRDFVASVDIFTNTNSEIVKTRYVDLHNGKKHIEINKFDTDGFSDIKIDTNDYDVVIVADFGHGFCDRLQINDGFFLMCQTNSNNFGFNRVSKWKTHQKAGVCIDLREASLQMNRKIKDPLDKQILELYNYETNTDSLFVTVGAAGSVFSDGTTVYRHNSYPSEIVDTIGAGDAFFSFSSLLSKSKLNKEDYLIVPSLAASLTTTWLCNEKSVTKNNLLKYATQFV